MNPLVNKLEEKLLPDFEEVAAKIREEIPYVLVTVYSGEVGSATQFQGYDFGIDCIFPDASDDETDNVALDVCLGYLTTKPRICAGVGWGHPSGKNEAEFMNWSGSFPNDGIVISDEILDELYKELPRLYEVLFAALKRRKPSDEC